MTTPCPTCSDGALRALDAALAEDDLDRAIALGLLQWEAVEPCAACAAAVQRVTTARDARLRALAARERYRARAARLTARAEARDRRRAAAQAVPGAPALPPSAADVLARAKARAAAKARGG